MSEEAGARRRGRRRGGAGAEEASAPMISGVVKRQIPYFDILSDEALETIEYNADTVLEEVGIDFKDIPEALKILKDNGIEVKGERARFPRGLARSLIQKHAPKEFVQHARNADRTVTVGGDNVIFVPAYGPPFVRDLDQGRRYATIEDFRNFVKLAYKSPHLNHSGGTICEPTDLPVNKRHLDMVYSHIRYSDKPFMGSVTAPERAEDSVEMARIAFGGDLGDRTVLVSLINANSPLTLDATMLGAAMAYSRNNQACVLSPFIIAGAMAPVTMVATLTQILAEALAGLSFLQMVKPGAPVIFGAFSSSMSMQSGAPTFGSPEPTLILYANAQLARRLGVPFRSGGGLCASKIPDAQAAYEAANTLQASAFAGVNFMLHSAGWLEGGLSMGYEKFILDSDQVGGLKRLLSGYDLSENGQGMDAFQAGAPGQHFLSNPHTQANFRDAFYVPPTSDNNSFEQWSSEGSLDAAQRANAVYKQWLAEYEAPPIDPAIDEELQAFMAKRKAAAPDASY